MESETPRPDEVAIRELSSYDAKYAAELSAELGYPVSTEAMEERIRHLTATDNHVVYAACVGDRVVGWIDVGIAQHLQSEAYGEIGGLVISAACQGLGIGKKLVRKAEEWIRSKQLRTVVVRSQIKREAAHEFYLKQDYSRVKTSAVFSKSL